MELMLPIGGAWSGDYKRSNKQDGRRNLICFPVHMDSIHRQGCHAPLLVRVEGAAGKDIKVVANFVHDEHVSSDEKKDSVRVVLSVGAEVKVADLAKHTRTKKNTKLEYIQPREAVRASSLKGVGIDVGTKAKSPSDAYFELAPRSWHYGWTAHSRSAKHCLVAYALEPTTNAGDALKCIAKVESPWFAISSSRGEREQKRRKVDGAVQSKKAKPAASASGPSLPPPPSDANAKRALKDAAALAAAESSAPPKKRRSARAEKSSTAMI